MPRGTVLVLYAISVMANVTRHMFIRTSPVDTVTGLVPTSTALVTYCTSVVTYVTAPVTYVTNGLYQQNNS